MADSTTHLSQIESGQSAKEVTANGLFDAASPAISYARHAETCLGLTWGYYGTRYGGTVVANGTYLCEANETTYMMVDLATGAVQFSNLGSDSDPAWDDPTYARAYIINTNGNAVTSYEDHRFGPDGVFGSGAASGLIIGVDVQAYDPDLSTIASLTATTDNFMQAKSSAWASRTVAQVSVDLQGTGLIADAVGFRTIPQNSRSADYTLVAADSGKHIFHPAADTTARTWTIPANSSVAFPIGTAITFDNDYGAGALTIAINSDALVLVGAAGTTGSRTIASGGQATAIKVTSTRWRISGTGLT